MKVCFVMCFPYPGTSSTAYYGYSQELARQGVDVFVIAACLAQGRSGIQRSRDGSVEVYKLPVGTFKKKSFEPTRFAFGAFALLGKLQGKQPLDILQMQAFPNLGLALRPTVRTANAVILDIRTLAISDRLFNAISRLVLRFQAQLFRHVVVVDPHVASDLFGERRDKFTVIPLGADFHKFYPGDRMSCRRELDLEPDDRVFIYVGNLDSVRTVDKVVLAFAELAEGQPRARLLLVGEGDQKDQLHLLVRQRQLEEQVVFTGSVPFSQVPGYLQAADIGLAYVSDKIQYRNQPPLKTVEYLATGLPVLATDTPGNRRFVIHRQNGLLVQDTVDDLVSGMRQMLDRQGMHGRMAQVARQSVRRFSYEHIVREQLIPFYERCLSRE